MEQPAFPTSSISAYKSHFVVVFLLSVLSGLKHKYKAITTSISPRIIFVLRGLFQKTSPQKATPISDSCLINAVSETEPVWYALNIPINAKVYKMPNNKEYGITDKLNPPSYQQMIPHVRKAEAVRIAVYIPDEFFTSGFFLPNRELITLSAAELHMEKRRNMYSIITPSFEILSVR